MPVYNAPIDVSQFSVGAVPSDHQLAAWTMDTAFLQGNVLSLGSGTLQVARLKVTNLANLINANQVTNIIFYLTSAGITLTSGRNFAGLYSDAGALLASTADMTSTWQSTGLKTMALSSPVTVTPWTWYKVAWFNNGLTAPSLARGTNLASAVLNAGLSGSTLRWSTADTGLTTTLPANIGTQTPDSSAWWCALS